MDTLEITLQRKTDDGWPVVVEYRPANELTIRREGFWEIGTDDVAGIEKKLLPHHRDPVAYGAVLGEALFQNEVRDLFREARARTPGYLRVLLVVEDPTLKQLHWEWLSGPIRTGGKWGLLSLDQRLPFSLYLPSVTERHFPPLAKSDLQALVVVANPPQGNPYKLASFVQSKTIAVVQQVLGDIPNELLADGDGGTELPTIDHLATQLSGKQYTLLYIIAHGMFQASSGETTLYLLDEQKQISPVPATVLIERLDMVQGRYGLPHFVFLATCESADPKAEALGALGGLAQRMVRELGIPAVVAMTQKVSIETANALAVNFFTRLCEHGEVDRALVEACGGLASRGEIAVPTLYSRLEGRPLFAVGGLREPTAREVKAALDKLDALVETRCPVLDEQYRVLAQTIRNLIDTANALLSEAARKEKGAALAAVNQLCEETLDLSFQGLALGQELPAYHAHECPFPGLYAFRMEDARFFFGREQVIQRLQSHLMRSNFLAVLGPSGSGKSSVVLAGLIPHLQKLPGVNLVLHRMTPTETPLVKLQEIIAGLAADETVTHVLVVDQAEELFTLCRDEAQRKAFLVQLLAIILFRYVIITMRADFLGDCARYPNLAEAVQNNLQLIAPMTTTELRSAMEQQANQVHLRFEADLSHTILSEVEGEPGAMPLLQHLLRQLWERRHGRWLLTKEYYNLGGIRKAIAHTADELYEDVQTSEQERELLRQIFVRLTRIDDETTGYGTFRDTRQRIKQSTLEQPDVDVEQLRSLINRLATKRLIVTRQLDSEVGTEIEVSHEALIRHWPRLQNWLNEDRVGLRLHQAVAREAEAWAASGRDGSYLRTGKRAEEIEHLYDYLRIKFTKLEKAYMDACIAPRRQRRQQEEYQSFINMFVDLEINISKDQNLNYHIQFTVEDKADSITYGGSLDANILEERENTLTADFGKELFKSLFANEQLNTIWIKINEFGFRYRISLKISPTVSELHALPWEMLCDTNPSAERQQFLAGSLNTPFYRLTETRAKQNELSFERPIKVLVAICEPNDLEKYGRASGIDIKKEQQWIQQTLLSLNTEAHAQVILNLLDEPLTPSRLISELANGYHILHLVAPGWSSADGTETAVFFTRENGTAQPTKVSELAEMIGRIGQKPRLIFLHNSVSPTNSARNRTFDPSKFANFLIDVGVPALIYIEQTSGGNLYNLFLQDFYQQLLLHGLVDIAANSARGKLFECAEMVKFAPILFSNIPKNQLFGFDDGYIDDWLKQWARDKHGIAPPQRLSESSGVDEFIDVQIIVHKHADHRYLVQIVLERAQLTAQGYSDLNSNELIPLVNDELTYGEYLFKTLFANETLRTAWTMIQWRYPKRRIRLLLDYTASELSLIHWERLRQPESDFYPAQFVSASAVTPFSRYLSIQRPYVEPIHKRPIKLLVAIVVPENLNQYESAYTARHRESVIDRGVEIRSILDNLSNKEAEHFELTIMTEPITLSAIAETLSHEYHILHILAWSVEKHHHGRSFMFLADSKNQAHVVHTAEFARMISQQTHKPLFAFLETGGGSQPIGIFESDGFGIDVFNAGVPAVLAMQYSMSIAASGEFCRAFYKQLFTHGAIDLAVNEARATLISAGDAFAFAPVLWSRLRGNRLFYKQNPENQPEEASLIPTYEHPRLELLRRALTQ